MKPNSSTISSLVAAILLGILLYMSDLSILPEYLSTNSEILIISICIFIITHFIKILRLYLLMKFSGLIKYSPMEFIPIGCLAVAISFALPFKSGELVTLKLYKDNFDIPLGSGLSVIVTTRIFDVLCMIFMVFLIMFQKYVYEIVGLLIFFYTIIFVAGIAVTALLYRPFGEYIINFFKKRLKGTLAKLVHKIEIYLTDYYDSMSTILKPFKAKVSFFIITLIRWSVEIYAWDLILKSFNHNLPIIQLAPFIAITIIIGFASGTPGTLGTSQITGAGILIVYGVPPETASLAMITGVALATLAYMISGGFGMALILLKRIRFFG